MTREQFIFEVRVCQGPLRRFLTTLCNGDSARGDDLAQETMLRAWLASDRFRGSFRPWLFRIAYNVFVDHFRRQPQGIDTMLGERGIGLSEGQAQRIAIARGLLRPGSILLLDEISSSLDEQTEQELFRRLFDYCKDKTMIFITHRPGVSLLCDNVIRLQ